MNHSLLVNRAYLPRFKLLFSLAALITRWLQRHRTRRQLTELPEYLLRDMGISRSEALNEASKPFWRA